MFAFTPDLLMECLQNEYQLYGLVVFGMMDRELKMTRDVRECYVTMATFSEPCNALYSVCLTSTLQRRAVGRKAESRYLCLPKIAQKHI